MAALLAIVSGFFASSAASILARIVLIISVISGLFVLMNSILPHELPSWMISAMVGLFEIIIRMDFILPAAYLGALFRFAILIELGLVIYQVVIAIYNWVR